MNDKDRVILGRLIEKSKNMHDDIKDIKNSVNKITGCVNSNELCITKLDTTMKNHFRSHRAGRSWIQWIPIMVTAWIAVIALILGL